MTPEAAPVRKTLTAVALAAALFAAVVIQLTVVNRLPLPGATAPDLVLLLVTAIAVNTSPTTGAVTGFAGGLALDVAPPAVHYAGQYALVFCLTGYAAARVVRAIGDMTGEYHPIIACAVMAGAAAAGEAGKAALGMLLSDPDVTGAAIRSVLPGAILYDLLLAPLAFWLVARVTRGAAPERAPAPEFGRDQRLASVFRQASAGAAPNLRLSNAISPSLDRTAAADSHAAPFPLAGGRTQKLNFAGNRPARPAKRAAATPGKNWLRTTAASSVRRTSAPGSLMAGASVMRSPGRRPPALKASAFRSSHLKSSALRSSAVEPSAFRSSAFGSSAFRSSGRPAAKRTSRTPGRGWLRSSGLPAAKRTSRTPGRGWLRSSAFKSSAFRSSAFRSSAFSSSGRPAAKRTSRTPGRGWLRSAGASPGGRAGSGGLGGAAGLTGPRSAAAAFAARSAPSGVSALSGAGTPLAGRRSPHAGWLRPSRSASPSRAAAGRLSPRRGWLGGDRRPRTVIGSRMSGGGVTFRRRRGATFRRSGTAYGNWYTASPSGAWLRRGRHPWRKRGERLLRIVGVGR